MDAEFDRRLQNELPPFDGWTLVSSQHLELSDLRGILRRIVKLLRQGWGDQGLWSGPDWYDHDGYLTSAQETYWSEVEEMLESDASFTAASPGDTLVHLAIFPESRDWYLRFYVPEEHEAEDFPARIDLTGPLELIDLIHEAMPDHQALSKLSAPTFWWNAQPKN